MRRLFYKLSDGLSRAWNKLVLVSGFKSLPKRCGANVTLGRRFEVAVAENISLGHDVYLGTSAKLLSTRAEIRVANTSWVGLSSRFAWKTFAPMSSTAL